MGSFTKTGLLLGVTVVVFCGGHVYGRLLPCDPLPMCMVPPPNCRHLTDERGCPTCELQCKKPCGPPPACAVPPDNCGLTTDENGCVSCQWQCSPCPPDFFCPNCWCDEINPITALA